MPGTVRRWVAGARVAPRAARLLPGVGVDLEGAQLVVAPTAIDRDGELVDGMPARLWTLRAGRQRGRRHLTTLAVFGDERLTSGRLTLDAGLRLKCCRAGRTRPHAASVGQPGCRAETEVADYRHGRLAVTAGSGAPPVNCR